MEFTNIINVFPQNKHFLTKIIDRIQKKKARIDYRHTSFNVAIASTTSLVKVRPAPDDPIKTVGFKAYA